MMRLLILSVLSACIGCAGPEANLSRPTEITRIRAVVALAPALPFGPGDRVSA